MKTYIALLRGINVGGKNSLPMKELSAILEHLGAQKVRTYIQSGNALFLSEENSAARLAQALRVEIKQQRGFEPNVLLLGLEQLEQTIRHNPFPEAESDPQSLHAGFLEAAPQHPALEALAGLRRPSEQFRLVGQVFYLHAPEGVGRSALAANAERLLGVAMTDRNWRTVQALWAMAQEL